MPHRSTDGKRANDLWREEMKKILLIVLFAMFMVTACVVTPGPYPTAGVVIAPPLPLIVELLDPFYIFRGFFYYYHNDRWYYSQSRNGPWLDLPRDRYPREVRYRGRGDERGMGEKRGHDRY